MFIEKRPCMKCEKSLATVKITRLVDGQAEERFLCRNCAAEESPYQKKTETTALPLDELLTEILGATAQESAARPAPAAASELTCKGCGLPFGSYRDTLILGCSDCYDSFEKILINDLQKFHGATAHTGRIPQAQLEVVNNYRNVEDLRRRLKDSVKAEDFVLAAKLRDQLREAEALEISLKSALQSEI